MLSSSESAAARSTEETTVATVPGERMFVKGTAYIARAAHLKRELGEKAWETFIQEYSTRNDTFSRTMLATTQIDVHDFIDLNDAVIHRFFDGDYRTYLRFGEESADWALRTGPYRKLFLAHDLNAFIERQPVVFRLYYSLGESHSHLEGNVVDYRIEIPPPYRHVYLEYSPVGYLRRGLELLGFKIRKTRCLQGFSRGDSRVHYRLFGEG